MKLNNMIAQILRKSARFWPDKLYLQLQYFFEMGEILNLKNPQSLTEKLQWLKLYNRRPEYTTMVDKYAVKKYVSDIIGEKYIIPTLGKWNNVKDIDFDILPYQFVLKTTHGGGCGGVVICKDKATFDKDSAIKKLQTSLNRDIYWNYREWPYKNVPKRIIAEQYMEDDPNKDLSDYKFYCFNGEPKYCQVVRDRNTKETIDFFDMQWNHMSFVGLNPFVSNGEITIIKPSNFDSMIEICRKLSKNIPFVRIDLYVIKGAIYFGEITFFPRSGLGRFSPAIWNDKLGSLIKLK